MKNENLRLKVIKTLESRYPEEVNLQQEFKDENLLLLNSVCEDLVESNLAIKFEHPTGVGEFLSLRGSSLLIERSENYGSYEEYIFHVRRQSILELRRVKYWLLAFVLGLICGSIIELLATQMILKILTQYLPQDTAFFVQLSRIHIYT